MPESTKITETATKIIRGLVETRINNPSPRGGRRQRRQERAHRSAQAQETFWDERLAAAADDPLELYNISCLMLRTRLSQLEAKAAKAVLRARTAEDKSAAQKRYEATFATVESTCAEVSEYLRAIASQIDTTRR